MGFVTFDSVLDEAYDLAQNPYDRIRSIVGSLHQIHGDQTAIRELYTLAAQNVELYKTYINK